MTELDIYCLDPVASDIAIVKKVMSAAEITTYKIIPFSKRDVLRFSAPINVVCSDLQPKTEGEELVYFWSSPKTFMSSPGNKKEVWDELKGSIVPMLKASQAKDDPNIRLVDLFGEEVSVERFRLIASKWKESGEHLVVSGDNGKTIHIFPGEKPGKFENEITLDELLILATALMTFGGAARVEGKDVDSNNLGVRKATSGDCIS